MSAARWLRRNWNLALQAAVALAAAAFGYFGEGTAHLGYAGSELAHARALFVLAACLVVAVLARRYPRPEHSARWLWAGVALICVAVAVLFSQGLLTRRWTCYSALFEKRFVFGATFTEGAKKNQQANEEFVNNRVVSEQEALETLRRTPPCELIEGAQQRLEEFWDTAEIETRRTTLSVLHTAGLPVFATGLLLVIQALHCSWRGVGHAERPPGRKVFLSYASDEQALAEEVNLALVQEGFEVFFDQRRLDPGAGYNRIIREGVRSADFFIFLISPASVAPGRYTLSEVALAQERWPDPTRRVLPVVVGQVPRAAVPAYLRAVTSLRPQGAVAAEVAAALVRLAAGDAPAADNAGDAPEA